MKLVLATANAHKLKELSALLPGDIELLGLKDIGLNHEIPEPGQTIEENSRLKAEHVRAFMLQKNLDYAVVADDSGLEAEALGGAPGVHSAYYAGLPKNDDANNAKLLRDLTPHANRKARFVTVLTFLSSGAQQVFEGEVKGTIAFEPRGNNGFGYDPLFIPTGYRSTFAQLSGEEKNRISHRAKAVEQFLVFLKSL